jgi:hypothetical protein
MDEYSMRASQMLTTPTDIRSPELLLRKKDCPVPPAEISCSDGPKKAE